ncbi:MAG TPA: hypothetical protein VF975_05785 [Thermoanaerobaculia bacterium]
MRRVVFAFIAGFLATITFHQIALALLHAAHVAPHAAWSMQPVPPFGVPSVISLSFWGGVWGIIMILLIDRFRGAAYWIWSIVFGAIAPTLVAAFVVAPLKHQPIPHSVKMAILGFTVNAAWGLGTALFYRLFSRK